MRHRAMRRGLRPRRLNFDDHPSASPSASVAAAIAAAGDGGNDADDDDDGSMLTDLGGELSALSDSVCQRRYEQFRRTWNFDPRYGPLPGPWVWQPLNNDDA